MSVWVGAMVAPSIIVSAPTSATTVMAVGDRLYSGANRATMKTPAVTMVAAWIKAEIGVGPFHRVGKPDMQRDLCRFADGSGKEQKADHRHHRNIPGAAERAEEVRCLGRQLPWACAKTVA